MKITQLFQYVNKKGRKCLEREIVIGSKEALKIK